MVILRDFPLHFYSTMDAFGSQVKMLLFDIFYEHISEEKSSIVKLDVLSRSKNPYLVAQTSKDKKKLD